MSSEAPVETALASIEPRRWRAAAPRSGNELAVPRFRRDVRRLRADAGGGQAQDRQPRAAGAAEPPAERRAGDGDREGASATSTASSRRSNCRRRAFTDRNSGLPPATFACGRRRRNSTWHAAGFPPRCRRTTRCSSRTRAERWSCITGCGRNCATAPRRSPPRRFPASTTSMWWTAITSSRSASAASPRRWRWSCSPTQPPFRKRMPVFVGDDSTDEDGLRAAAKAGGFGVKVGPGHTQATYCLHDVSAVHAWLARHI